MKVKTARRKSTGRPKKAEQTVEGYVASAPESSRKAFNQLLAAVRSAVPSDAIEVLSYGIPAFKTDRVIVWFAAFTNHCSLFPTSSIIAAFKTDLQRFRTSKGTIHFPLDKAVPAALVKKLVKARVAQVAGAKGR
jgi:uncharacterized protein YdhG (YjbR/CyaY superfamily)